MTLRLHRRPPDLGLPPPSADLRAVVAVPARNEEDGLPRLVAALAAQTDARLGGVELLVVLNNTTDGSAAAVRQAAERVPHLTVHVADVTLGAHEAHVGRARQIALDVAYARLGGRGLILTTDADTRPLPDWIAQTEAEIARGADAVGGRILLCSDDRAAMPARLRRLVLLDTGYRRALERLHSLLAPEPHDPYPRHHQHFGGSLAVTARAYARAGGLPAAPCLEDVAFVRALARAGARLRHSDRVRVWTSARVVGRTCAGLSTEMARMAHLAETGQPLLVESAAHAAERLRRLGLWRRDCVGIVPPLDLTEAPYPIPTDAEQEVGAALRDLRTLAERLDSCPPDARLAAPRRLAA